jgi:hypothetical protein
MRWTLCREELVGPAGATPCRSGTDHTRAADRRFARLEGTTMKTRMLGYVMAVAVAAGVASASPAAAAAMDAGVGAGHPSSGVVSTASADPEPVTAFNCDLGSGECKAWFADRVAVWKVDVLADPRTRQDGPVADLDCDQDTSTCTAYFRFAGQEWGARWDVRLSEGDPTQQRDPFTQLYCNADGMCEVHFDGPDRRNLIAEWEAIIDEA